MLARDAEEGIGAFIEKRDAEMGRPLIASGTFHSLAPTIFRRI